MILSGSLKRNAAMLAGIFLLCGFLNVIFEDIGFTECSRLYCVILVLLWALSIQERVTDIRLRDLLLWIAALILSCSLLQIFRDQFFSDSLIVQRYLWYIHYAPMMGISLLCFFLSLCIYRPAEKPVAAVCWLPVIAGAALTLGVLTNDVHYFAFHFADGDMTGLYEPSRAWLIYLFMAFLLATIFLSSFIILKKHQKYCTKRHCVLSLIPVFIEVFYVILYALGSDPQINGIHLWDYGEIFCICTITFLETCIQIGMIPANKDYDKLFSASSYPAVILDNAGNVVYRTSGTQYPFPASEDIQIMRHQILGGSIEWTVDMKYTRILTQQLAEATQRLESRNAYLTEENRIKREKAELETRNRLYDKISRIIHTQLSEINTLLNDTETPLGTKLPKISVLKAYIKRRSNMELLASSGLLPAEELTAAITESLEYLQLCGAKTAVSSFGAGTLPADMVIAAYERFEDIAEKSFDTLSHINVSVRTDKNSLILRILLKAENFPYGADDLRQEGSGFPCKASITKEGPDIHLAFTFEKGGNAYGAAF